MNGISEKFANVLGSVGIVALVIAMLLVPYSDLNAASSSGTYCVFTRAAFYNKATGNCGCNGDCVPNPPCSCSSTKKTYKIGNKIYVQCKCSCPVYIP